MIPAMDYDTRIDSETWAFIRATERCYPPDAASMTIADMRRSYDAMCQVFHRGYPPGIIACDAPIAGVPCRIFPGSQPTVIYLHGGSLMLGGLGSHDDVCAEIRARTGLGVVVVDYRLMPEHDRHAALADCCAVIRDLASQGPVVLAGDSAGGFLAAAAAHQLRPERLPILGKVLIYPGLGGDIDQGSYITHAHAPLLTRDDVLSFSGKSGDAGHPAAEERTIFPLRDTDFRDLPPTVAISAECDPLCDDGPAYAARIRAAGGRAHASVEPGLVHGYLRARATVRRAADSFTRICDAIAALAAGDWPYPEGS